MKSKILEQENLIFIRLEGKLDHDSTDSIKESLYRVQKSIHTDSVPRQIIFDFKQLQFVGSSGITSFIHTMKNFNLKTPNRPVYAQVSTEFQKMIKAFDPEQTFDFIDDASAVARQILPEQ